jgi:hypothetical protein
VGSNTRAKGIATQAVGSNTKAKGIATYEVGIDKKRSGSRWPWKNKLPVFMGQSENYPGALADSLILWVCCFHRANLRSQPPENQRGFSRIFREFPRQFRGFSPRKLGLRALSRVSTRPKDCNEWDEFLLSGG